MANSRVTIHIGAEFLPEQVEAMDAWREAQPDPHLTRANALEYFVAVGLGMKPPTFTDRKRPLTEAERDKRAEYYIKLRADLGSTSAVARHVGYSASTVAAAIARHERKKRLSALKQAQRTTAG